MYARCFFTSTRRVSRESEGVVKTGNQVCRKMDLNSRLRRRGNGNQDRSVNVEARGNGEQDNRIYSLADRGMEDITVGRVSVPWLLVRRKDIASGTDHKLGAAISGLDCVSWRGRIRTKMFPRSQYRRSVAAVVQGIRQVRRIRVLGVTTKFFGWGRCGCY